MYFFVSYIFCKKYCLLYLVFLEKVGKEGGPFDVIVDDGGHSRQMQINSLIGLWPYVKSNGFYIIEDLGTNFNQNYNDKYLLFRLRML